MKRNIKLENMIKARGLKKNSLAEKTGLTKPAITLICQGRDLKVSSAKKICKVLDCKIDDVF